MQNLAIGCLNIIHLENYYIKAHKQKVCNLLQWTAQLKTETMHKEIKFYYACTPVSYPIFVTVINIKPFMVLQHILITHIPPISSTLVT